MSKKKRIFILLMTIILGLCMFLLLSTSIDGPIIQIARDTNDNLRIT